MTNLDQFVANLFNDGKKFSISYLKTNMYESTVQVTVDNLVASFDADGKFLKISTV